MNYKFIRHLSLAAAICFSSVAIAQPAPPTISGASTYCEGSTLSLTASSAAAPPTYSRTGPGGYTASTGDLSHHGVGIPNSGV